MKQTGKRLQRFRRVGWQLQQPRHGLKHRLLALLLRQNAGINRQLLMPYFFSEVKGGKIVKLQKFTD